MKKLLLVAIMATGLVACTQSPAPKEDSKLRDAYSACITSAEGNPDKVEACQSVLNVLKQEKQHQQFATQESGGCWTINSVSRRAKPVTIRPCTDESPNDFGKNH
ncbi:lipoprotein ybfN [Klebsiella oxytoca]|nr:lipoprotein ybfN [Klebsiella oxytoca]